MFYAHVLADESVFYKCPDRLRLPLIFYYGHTACVYVNKMILADLIQVNKIHIVRDSRTSIRLNLRF